MYDADSTLTDYALTLLCGSFAIALLRARSPHPLRGWFALLFATAAVAALLGGTVHGFLPDETGAAHRALWRATLATIGVTAFAGFAAAARLLAGDRIARVAIGAGGLALAGYVLFVASGDRPFSTAIAAYLPAVLFLLVALLVAWRRHDDRGALWMAAGLGVTLVAAALQQLRVGLHPDYLDHNAVYHLVEAVGFVLMFSGARAMLTAGGGAHADPA